jgi:hypothetical protein
MQVPRADKKRRRTHRGRRVMRRQRFTAGQQVPRARDKKKRRAHRGQGVMRSGGSSARQQGDARVTVDEVERIADEA